MKADEAINNENDIDNKAKDDNIENSKENNNDNNKNEENYEENDFIDIDVSDDNKEKKKDNKNNEEKKEEIKNDKEKEKTDNEKESKKDEENNESKIEEKVENKPQEKNEKNEDEIEMEESLIKNEKEKEKEKKEEQEKKEREEKEKKEKEKQEKIAKEKLEKEQKEKKQEEKNKAKKTNEEESKQEFEEEILEDEIPFQKSSSHSNKNILQSSSKKSYEIRDEIDLQLEKEKSESIKNIELQKSSKKTNDLPPLKTVKNINLDIPSSKKQNFITTEDPSDTNNFPSSSRNKNFDSEIDQEQSQSGRFLDKFTIKYKYTITNNLNNRNFDDSNFDNYNDNSDYFTIVDLLKNPNNSHMNINSPRSLRVVYDTGCTLDELYYKPFNIYLKYHPEIMDLSENEQIKRYNFYNEMRINRIKDLCQYREYLIKNENEDNINFNSSILNRTASQQYQSNFNEKHSIKEKILNSNNKNRSNGLYSAKKSRDKELADILEFELNTYLFDINLNKPKENYNKRNEKLNNKNINTYENLDNNQFEKMNEAKKEYLSLKKGLLNNSNYSQNYPKNINWAQHMQMKNVSIFQRNNNSNKNKKYSLKNDKIVRMKQKKMLSDREQFRNGPLDNLEYIKQKDISKINEFVKNSKNKNNKTVRPKSHNRLFINANQKSPLSTDYNLDFKINSNSKKNIFGNNKNAIKSNKKRVKSSYARTYNNIINTEDTIQKKVGQYKDNAYKDFFKLVNEEKLKEKRREKQLNEITNQKIKKNLEIQFGKERAMANDKLENENGKIIEKVGIYENKLRKKNALNKLNNFNY